MTEIFSQINIIDILMLAILARVVFIGYKNGVGVEFYKVIATLVASFVVLHYFTALAKFFIDWARFTKPLAEFVSFILLWLVITALFALIRDGLLTIFKIKISPVIDKGGGLLLGLGRAFLTCSLALILIYVSGIGYFIKQAKYSLSAGYLKEVAPNVYEITFNQLIKPFFPAEKINRRIGTLERAMPDVETAEPKSEASHQDSEKSLGFFGRGQE